MHYKNGREAKAGTCNALFAYVVPGGVANNYFVTVGECYHAEDGFAALDAAQPDPTP